jgi:hypothetical protein
MGDDNYTRSEPVTNPYHEGPEPRLWGWLWDHDQQGKRRRDGLCVQR